MQKKTRKRQNQTMIIPRKSNHRLLYLLATLLFILAAALAAPMTARAAGTEPATKDNVYQIGTADELIWFRDSVNSGDIPASSDAKLTSDIVLSGEWGPIGKYTDKTPNGYTGTFNGGGFTVSGYEITSASLVVVPKIYRDTDGKAAGFFGYIGADGKVINLTLDGEIDITSTGEDHEQLCVGGFAGYNMGTLRNCTNTSGVKTLYTCAKPNTDVNSHTGGVIGYNMNGTLANCVNNGRVDASGYYCLTGGIAATADGSSVISGCVNTNSVCSAAGGEFPSEQFAGGITGRNPFNGANVKLSNCINSGEITATGTINNFAGGISARDNTGIIANCTNTGDVTASGNNARNYAGGIVGYSEYSKMSDCVSSGTITADGTIPLAGGITGKTSDLTTRNCGWMGADKGTGDDNSTSLDIHKISGETGVVTTLTATLDKSLISVGEQGTITLKTLLDNAGFAAHVTNVKAAASDNSVLKVEETTGSAVAFTAAGRGESTITVTATLTPTDFGGGKASAKNVTFTFYIEVRDDAPKPISVENVTLSSRDLTLNVGESAQLTATVSPINATDKSVTWSSSAPETVSTDQSGKLTALKAGKATVTVTTNNGGETDSCAVTVNSPAKPQPKQPDVDNSVEISKDIDISETPAVYDNMEAAAKDISSDIKAEELEVSDGSVSLKDTRAKEIIKANLEDGAALESILTLPLFSVRTEKGKTAVSAWVVKGSDLLSDTIEKVDVRKIVSTTEMLKFRYKASGFTDGSFTVLGMDGKLAAGAVDKDKKYQLLLFIADGGKYDLNDAVGVITDPAAIVKTGGAPAPKPSGGSSGGCSAGFGTLALLALVPPALKKKR
ncbi:Ig-like domain-containing protein [Cloacibacillus sp.]